MTRQRLPLGGSPGGGPLHEEVWAREKDEGLAHSVYRWARVTQEGSAGLQMIGQSQAMELRLWKTSKENIGQLDESAMELSP